jgi:hypothetical protein
MANDTHRGISLSRSRTVLLVALVVVAGTTTILIGRQTSRASKKVDDLRDELTAMKEDRSSAPLVIREVRTEKGVVAAPPGSAQGNVAPPSSGLSPLEVHEKMDAHLKLINETKMETFGSTHSREARDPKWSDAAERSIRQKYAAEEFRTAKVSADCRSTLCKIEFSFADPAAGLEGGRQLMSAAPPWNASRFMRVDQEANQALWYLAREGKELPSFDVPPPPI